MAGWLPKESKSKRQGTDREIVFRNYKLRSVHRIAMNGNVIKVIDTAIPAPAYEDGLLNVSAPTEAEIKICQTLFAQAEKKQAERQEITVNG